MCEKEDKPAEMHSAGSAAARANGTHTHRSREIGAKIAAHSGITKLASRAPSKSSRGADGMVLAAEAEVSGANDE